MVLLIRRAQPSDLPAIGVLWQELAEMHAQFAPEWVLVPDAVAHWSSHTAEMLGQENRCLIVAEQDGVIVGFIVGMISDMPPTFVVRSIGQISDAVVTSHLRRKGVGEQLFRALQTWFKERGVSIVHLSAVEVNQAGQAFWHKMGFRDHMTRMRGEFK